MILLQILLIPTVVVLLMGVVLIIGTSGCENPKCTTWIDQDSLWIDDPGSDLKTSSMNLPYQTFKSIKAGTEEAFITTAEIISTEPDREPLPASIISRL